MGQNGQLNNRTKVAGGLIVCADLLADYDEAEGEEGDAFREALAAIAEATGRAT